MTFDPADLSELQRDALIEIFNIGVGQAASSMSQIVGEAIEVTIPAVEILHGDNRTDAISKLALSPRICAVSQEFAGSLDARAFLIFPEGKTRVIVRRMVGDSVSIDELTEMEQEALCEIGNIILNSCMSSLSEAFQTSFRCSLPAYHLGTADEVMSTNGVLDKDLLMLCHIIFSMPKAQIDSYLIFLLTLPSFKALISHIDQFLSGIQRGASLTAAHSMT